MPIDPISAGIAIGGPILSGIFGNASAAGDRAAAQQQIEAAIRELEKVGVPPMEAMQVSMEYLKSVGQLTPELEEAIYQKDTEMKNIAVDPRTKEAQFRALAELEEIGDSGGLRLSDEAAINDVMGDIETRSRGARQAIEGDLKARGAFGSGAELASKLANQQEQAQAANAAGLNIAAGAQDRALQAIIEAGELGGNLRGQDFDEQEAIARAQDEINAFNTANRADVVRRNTAARNAANEFNLRNEQRIADENVGIRNQQEAHNKGLYQQDYENRLGKATTMANARTGNASQLNQQAKETAASWGRVGQGIGQVGATLATANQGKESQRVGTFGPGSMSGTDKKYLRTTDDDEIERLFA